MKNKILFILCLLFGILFINSGLNKVFTYMPMPESLPVEMLNLMNCFSETGWLMQLLAFMEVLGGILIIPTRTRALGAIIIFPIMIGIVLTHTFNAPSGLALAIILLAINSWVIIENWKKYTPMIKS